jgi:hypothetical protein
MTFALDGGSQFFQALLKSLQRLRLDHSAHLGERPDQRQCYGLDETDVAQRNWK